jgi:hypothetical protein
MAASAFHDVTEPSDHDLHETETETDTETETKHRSNSPLTHTLKLSLSLSLRHAPRRLPAPHHPLSPHLSVPQILASSARETADRRPMIRLAPRPRPAIRRRRRWRV